MSNVKLTRKDILERIQAKIVVEHQLKITQQEILDKCLEFADLHWENFIREMIMLPPLSKEKLERILKGSLDVPLYELEKSKDEILYGGNSG